MNATASATSRGSVAASTNGSSGPATPARPSRRHRRNERKFKRAVRIGRWYERASLPFAVVMLLGSGKIHPAYGMTRRRKFAVARRLARNTRRIETGISYKAHLAMLAKLLEIPPAVRGVVVECGCWLGGTTANLSVICDIVGRDLIVYDSFEGLPAPEPGDQMGPQVKGSFKGAIDVVQDNVRRHGVIDRCTFRKGWFSDTLGDHAESIVMCFVDVDLKSSMHDCIVHLWPHLTEQGYLFFDEYVHLHNCSLFFSERFWRDYLDTTPPGLMGTGTGVGVGQYFLGPWLQTGTPMQRPSSIGYTRKDYNGRWDYHPEGKAMTTSPLTTDEA